MGQMSYIHLPPALVEYPSDRAGKDLKDLTPPPSYKSSLALLYAGSPDPIRAPALAILEPLHCGKLSKRRENEPERNPMRIRTNTTVTPTGKVKVKTATRAAPMLPALR